MTRRERMERRAERRREWAEGRRQKSDAAFGRAREIADGIPFGQPILVGHHSEGAARRDQARIESGLRAGVESHRMAEHHLEKADGIEAQLARSIFSDDPDAIERLQERIAELEAKRDRVKAYNASCRKGAPDESLLDDAQRADLVSITRHCPYQLGKKGELPGYELTNIGGNIRRLQKRLDALRGSTT